MNFEPLFLTSRVMTAVYRIASTTLLLIYLAQRPRRTRNEQRVSRRANPFKYDDGNR